MDRHRHCQPAQSVEARLADPPQVEVCLPSGSSLTHADQDRVIASILELAEAPA